jgi:hypothetical protein
MSMTTTEPKVFSDGTVHIVMFPDGRSLTVTMPETATREMILKEARAKRLAEMLASGSLREF